MAYDEELATRIEMALASTSGVTFKKMFGGIAFMVDGKMACGVIKGDLMLRVDPADGEKALSKPFVRPMDFSGRPMVGYLYVSERGWRAEADLRQWLMGSVQYARSLPTKAKKAPAKSKRRL